MRRNVRIVTELERLAGRRVSWTQGVPVEVKRRLGKLLAVYAGHLPTQLVVGFSPALRTSEVFSIHRLDNNGVLLDVTSQWWHSSPDRIEYDLVMNLTIAQLAGTGLLRVGPNGLEIDGAKTLGIKPIEYLNALANKVITDTRAAS